MQLADAAVIRSGLVLARKHARKTTAFRYTQLNLRSIESNGTINTDLADIFDATEPLNAEYLTQENDIVIRLSAPYTAVLINESTTGMVISSNFVVIRTDERTLVPGYLYWLLNTRKVKKQIYENATNNMLGAINTKYFSTFEISNISVQQQRIIANLHLLAKRENQLLFELAAEKDKYHAIMINRIQKDMRRGICNDNEK